MQVSRYDYSAQFDGVLDDVLSRIRTLLLRGDYVLNDDVRSFESNFARTAGTAYARGIGSGTDALLLTLRALGIGPGDEVITQANTFYATVAAIVHAGATPVLVDADDETYLIDQSQIERGITARTRAIVPVHLYGKPTPMERLLELARARGVAVIEDAAQAHGATWNGKRVGSFGTAGCFSFHPSKNLAAAGDAGCITTDSAELAESLEAYRMLGQRVQNEHTVLGMNSKLDAIQAIVLNAKIERLDQWNAQRRDVARYYRSALAGLPISFQREDPGEEHAYHLFQIRTPRRNELLTYLQERKIDAVIRYPHPIHLQTPFAQFGWQRGDFPVAESLANELLCLPIRPQMTKYELAYVVEHVRNFHALVPA